MSTGTHDGMTVAGGTGDGGERRRSLWKTPAAVTALFVLAGSLGNHFVEGWNWEPLGFVRIGIILFGFGLAYELVTRNMDTIAYRAAVAVALVTALGLLWANFVQMADVNIAAAMYFGVPLVGIIGAVIARLRPAGMTRALFATAFAQALILTITLIRNPHVTSWAPAVTRGFAGNALFVMLFVGSALLFRTAARGKR
ncbi:MAG: hypothetical protein QOI58_3603 [Thermoanaerobaculia bacterium]|jgi:hypothetical protein|nr:hypothetical protein [Thermoanaerobaculia bacterium]